MKPIKVFIGSSSEATDPAYWLQSVLQTTPRAGLIEATVWTDDIFELTETTLPSLYQAIAKHDFAVFLFQPDDRLETRAVSHPAVRDNVVFETGLFMGGLGRRNVIILKPADLTVKFPSDLLAINYVTYDSARFQREPESSMRAACTRLSTYIRNTHQKNLTKRLAPRIPQVRRMLEIAARRFAEVASVPLTEIRAFCHLIDPNDLHLKPFALYTADLERDDKDLCIPCTGAPDKKQEEDWFIISKCYRSKKYCCENVNWDLARTLELNLSDDIWGQLQGVAAYPIRRIGAPREILGTIAVDSSKSIQDLNWERNSTLPDNLSLVSDILYSLLAS